MLQKFLKKKTDVEEREAANDAVDLQEVTEEQTELPLEKRVGKLPKNMVSRFKEHDSHVFTLRIIIGGLLIALVMSLHALSQAPKQLRIRIPPDISNGAVINPNGFPKASVLSDVSYLWTAMNTWQTDGTKDTEQNLFRWQHFYSPEFLEQLREEYKRAGARGELNRKKRSWLAPASLMEFNDRVIETTSGSWIVYIDMKTEEDYMNRTVKSTTIRYPLLVERYDANIEMNPLGLRIVGYADRPQRISSD
ncbi:PFL_4703 family integrating conjugative element protein [Vibrio agarivorans]|uniref:TIGR03746 family integrating conjugative element protein n=1 Tax=Vibrio agarivorans TaxID=153622 RepID=A0ABT7Y7A3_9VIBR|nr:TIGR03746 family integrating conjugative element protein [Vibrio agarivorans]MDN2483941.1 TIGR03746 family integrating conjugative element protein [Vibrio agarivorans]